MPPKKKKARQSAPASTSSTSPPVKQGKSNVATPQSKKIRLVQESKAASRVKKEPATQGNGTMTKAKITKRKQDTDDETESEIEEGEVILVGDKRAAPTLSTSTKTAGPSAQRAVSAPQPLPPKPALASVQKAIPKVSAPVATAAALPVPHPPPAWNDTEKKEAMRLIKDITSLGLKPLQLVEAGIRQDIVIACCRELNISMNGSAIQPDPRERLRLDEHPLITSQIARSPSPPFSSSIKIKSETEGRALSSSPAGLPAKPVWTESISIDHSQVNPKLLSKKARRAIQKQADERVSKVSMTHAADKRVDSISANAKASGSNIKMEDISTPMEMSEPALVERQVTKEEVNPMEKMRLAALASMKRKKVAASIASSNGNGSISIPLLASDAPIDYDTLHPDHAASKDHTAMIFDDALPPDIPKGPRLGKPVYHDIDAPQAQSIDLEVEEGEIAEVPSSSRIVDADPRQSRRSNMSYADDYSWEIDAPSGDVDLEAPLPSLQAKSVSIDRSRVTHPLPNRPKGRRPLAADLMEMSGASTPEYYPRPRPFLANGIHTQRLVLECSDDEDEEGSDENGKARQASTAFISQIYKQLNNSEDDLGSISRNGLNLPTPPNAPTTRRVSPSSSNADLDRKEQEIREMMAKIQELEKKRGQVPSDPKVLAEVVMATVEEAKGKVDTQQSASIHLPSAGPAAANGSDASAVRHHLSRWNQSLLIISIDSLRSLNTNRPFLDILPCDVCFTRISELP